MQSDKKPYILEKLKNWDRHTELLHLAGFYARCPSSHKPQRRFVSPFRSIKHKLISHIVKITNKWTALIILL